jgi:hypothetical protein
MISIKSKKSSVKYVDNTDNGVFEQVARQGI